MKSIKKIGIIFLLSITYCTTQPNSTPPNSLSNLEFPKTVINTDPIIQAQFKEKWLENTTNITKGSYFGEVDIWGFGAGGAIKMNLWFNRRGNLWNAFTSDNRDFVLHYLLTANTNEGFGANDPMTPKANYSFIDGTTAIVWIPNSASYKLSGNLYILRITNNAIYRTKDSLRGFANLIDWNKTTIPAHQLEVIATNINPTAPPTPPTELETNLKLGLKQLGSLEGYTRQWARKETVNLIKSISHYYFSDTHYKYIYVNDDNSTIQIQEGSLTIKPTSKLGDPTVTDLKGYTNHYIMTATSSQSWNTTEKKWVTNTLPSPPQYIVKQLSSTKVSLMIVREIVKRPPPHLGHLPSKRFLAVIESDNSYFGDIDSAINAGVAIEFTVTNKTY